LSHCMPRHRRGTPNATDPDPLRELAMTHDPHNDDTTADELEQQQDSDPAAEFRGREADPEHPDQERVWPQADEAERLDEADPADLIEQARPADESPETADDEP